MIDLADEALPDLVELRVLDGPNLYFSRPAVKLTVRPGAIAELDEGEARRVAALAGMRRRGAVGAPGSEQRLLHASRLVEAVLRAVARRSGTARLGVRSRPALADRTVVVAFPWRRLERARALARATAWVVADPARLRSLDDTIEAAAAWCAVQPDGPAPATRRPAIPTVCITGTNGKTTVTRLVAHLATTAGHTVAWCTSDGVYVAGELVEPGDLTGFVGARTAVEAPGATFAVIEAARGGLLRRGLGVASVDVGVLTNVSADHLGLGGIDTLDQLAEVKGTVVRVARTAAVLNAEDPRVLALRTATRAQPWAFSLDPAAPGIRHVLDAGGRAVTVIDGCVTVLGGAEPVPVTPVRDIPITIGGLSRHNVANALTATAAALAIGLPSDAVAAGLTSFAPTPDQNPGRMNLFDLEGTTVVVDYGHNEEGLRALLEVAGGLRAEGAELHLVLNGVGDRTDDVLAGMGELAGRLADHVVIAERRSALRGREPASLWGTLRAGLGIVGVSDVPGCPSEVEAMAAALVACRAGDVCAVMAHDEREAVFAWLDERGARVVHPDELLARTPDGTN